MSAPSPIPYRQPGRRALRRLRREARARARRLPVYPDSRIEQQFTPGPRFWRGVLSVVLIEAAFIVGAVAAYHWLRWWL